MTRRAWLPHPAKTIGQPPDCPTGVARYTTRDHALHALTHGLGAHRLTATPCQQGCGGWHNTPAEPPPAGDCEPAWQPAPTLAARRDATDVPTGDLL